MYDVAVLIPTYKPGKYFDSCLKSIEAQTLSKDRFRVYILLNGPEEPFKRKILNTLQEYTFNYSFFYTSTTGVSNARNNLIDTSIEPYLTFIDDDDIISKNYLEELFNNATPQFMSISNVKVFKENMESAQPNYIGRKFKALNHNETSKFKSRQYYSSPVAKMLHREMIGSVKFDTSLSKGEDALFMTEISKNILAISKTHPSAIYFVYERAGSASRSKTNLALEVKRTAYLISRYSKMLFQPRNEKLFITSRIVATIKHLKSLICL